MSMPETGEIPDRLLPGGQLEPRRVEQDVGSSDRTRSTGTPEERRRCEQSREEVGEHQSAVRRQHAKTLREPGSLVAPVIEGRCRDDEIEHSIGEPQVLGGSRHEMQAIVVGVDAGHLNHAKCRIDAGERDRCRASARKFAERVAAPKPDVEDVERSRKPRECYVHGPIRDAVIQFAEPTARRVSRPLGEWQDGAIRTERWRVTEPASSVTSEARSRVVAAPLERDSILREGVRRARRASGRAVAEFGVRYGSGFSTRDAFLHLARARRRSFLREGEHAR